jgi:hypothetical protein
VAMIASLATISARSRAMVAPAAGSGAPAAGSSGTPTLPVSPPSWSAVPARGRRRLAPPQAAGQPAMRVRNGVQPGQPPHTQMQLGRRTVHPPQVPAGGARDRAGFRLDLIVAGEEVITCRLGGDRGSRATIQRSLDIGVVAARYAPVCGLDCWARRRSLTPLGLRWRWGAMGGCRRLRLARTGCRARPSRRFLDRPELFGRLWRETSSDGHHPVGSCGGGLAGRAITIPSSTA